MPVGISGHFLSFRASWHDVLCFRLPASSQPVAIRSATQRMSNLERYQRIAPFYDFLDLPFEYGRYRKIRPFLFEGLSGLLLDAGVGTGRNFPFYPPTAEVIGGDMSPAMLGPEPSEGADRPPRRSSCDKWMPPDWTIPIAILIQPYRRSYSARFPMSFRCPHHPSAIGFFRKRLAASATQRKMHHAPNFVRTRAALSASARTVTASCPSSRICFSSTSEWR
jgi:SAM-dependent methyltransferase